MGVHPELLEILACPSCKVAVRTISLPEEVCGDLVERYRPKFRDEEPVVVEGLQCKECGRVFPIVSDIPVMLLDEALTL